MKWQRRQWLKAAALTVPGLALPWMRDGLAQAEAVPLLSRFGQPLQGRPARVIAAGPPAAVLTAALVPGQLLGWPARLPQGAQALLSPTLARLPVVGRLSGRGSTLGVEGLLALAPDVIIDAGTVDGFYRAQAERLAAQSGITCVLVDGRLPQNAQQLREVGALLGVPQRAEQLAAYADAVLAQAQQRRTRWNGDGPRFYLARGADGLETGWQGAINAELLEFVGLRNVAQTRGQGSVGRVSLEQVLAWNPDVIVTQQPGLAAQISADPRWRGIRAVQMARVWQVPSVPFGWVDGPPGINRLVGLRWLNLMLADGLHDISSTEDRTALQARVRHEAQVFHQLFYGTPADAVWPAESLP
ncbi:ABC transporter substrate-binding protein [Lampropedia cohaerens]|uniref:ABC transporter substrate-binding protein n=1 Tax=Lampropedia cohaerens TaxID=1610491 RepID=UPI000699DCBB|nr:ABC transporter substrate-binding protein [Lampropedia cohaerens]